MFPCSFDRLLYLSSKTWVLPRKLWKCPMSWTPVRFKYKGPTGLCQSQGCKKDNFTISPLCQLKFSAPENVIQTVQSISVMTCSNFQPSPTKKQNPPQTKKQIKSNKQAKLLCQLAPLFSKRARPALLWGLPSGAGMKSSMNYVYICLGIAFDEA